MKKSKKRIFIVPLVLALSLLILIVPIISQRTYANNQTYSARLIYDADGGTIEGGPFMKHLKLV